MPVINSLAAVKDEFAETRRELHQNPQTKYEETFASDLVAAKLTEWGIPFKRGYATTGIVATITGQKTDSGKAIGLRADMDALDILEKSGQPWASKNPGKMHACGHDGHTTTLLGVAKYLNENRDFNGTVHLIFQPAEEGGNGGQKMIEDGVLDDFQIDQVFAIHNWPEMPIGKIGMRVGGMMASVDEFHITVQGRGGHAAIPQQTVDPIVVASHIVTALQTIVSRTIDPIESAVLTVANINAGLGAFNIIPDTAVMSGTFRSYNQDVRQTIGNRMKDVIDNVAAAFGATATCEIIPHNLPTVNTAAEVELAATAARKIVGDANVNTDIQPSMGGEDFSFFLEARPGAYIFVGQGVPNEPESPHNRGLHHPRYDFNDDILPIGMSYFAELVRTVMPLEK